MATIPIWQRTVLDLGGTQAALTIVKRAGSPNMATTPRELLLEALLLLLNVSSDPATQVWIRIG